jgi:ABC-type lipoprotein release transport system permease subunit
MVRWPVLDIYTPLHFSTAIYKLVAALTRIISSLLLLVSSMDAVTFASMSIPLAAVALLVRYIPARRATRVDPMVTMRKEY